MKKRQKYSAEISADDNHALQNLFGPQDSHIRILEKRLNVEINARGNEIVILGPHAASVSTAKEILAQLYQLIKKGHPLITSDIEDSIRLVSHDKTARIESLFLNAVAIPTRKQQIVPRSKAQKSYLKAISDYDIVLSIGPAGTGKTYLACAMAVSLLLKKEFKRIILARPAVEAGEKLGFLPGDMVEKINPYLKPLYDALYDMLEMERVEEMIETGVIEVAPIAFMRGRTLNNAFVIIDEAQNASYQQIKMCLTRLGADSKMVVTGDITQIDLPLSSKSGLLAAWRILKGIEGIAFHTFTEVDIVRHPLVSKIVTAFERDEKKKG